MVSFDHQSNSSNVNHRICRLTIEQSDAIILKKNENPSCSCAHAIVSAEPPHHFAAADSSFAAAFGHDEHFLLAGRGMADLRSAGSDVLRWATVFQSACEGRVGTTTISLRAPDGGERRTVVTCTPVAAAANGPIAQILVHLAPAADTPALSPSALAAKIPRERGRAPRPRPSGLRGGQDGGLARGRGRRHTGILDESG